MIRLEAAKNGDTVQGTCNAPSHGVSVPVPCSGTWAVTRPNFSILSIPGVLVGDTCNASCGHVFRAKTGGSWGGSNGKAIHRDTDEVEVIESVIDTTVVGFGTTTSIGLPRLLVG